MELTAGTDPRRCLLCHDALGSRPVECSGCGARHHRECLAEFAGCGSLGCAQRTQRPPRRRATAPGRRERAKQDLLFLAAAATGGGAFFAFYYGWQGAIWGALLVATTFVLPKRF